MFLEYFVTLKKVLQLREDKSLVLDMVKGYIEQERTIILAVLPSTVDIMTQEILNLSEKYDKSGERTLGVLTKPDLLTERSTKSVICDLVNGKKRPLNLGYYVVRNRGADEDSNDGLASKRREEMFKEEPWCHLPPERVGIIALRERLQELLGQITDRAFPKLRTEAKKLLADCNKSLEALGFPDKRSVSNSSISVKLPHSFKGPKKTGAQSAPQTKEHQEYSSQDLDPTKFPELNDIVDVDLAPTAPQGDILKWIKCTYRGSRGVELGTFGPSLLSSAFREQSTSWGPLTKVYLSKIILVIHRFILRVLALSCADTKVLEEIKSFITSELLDRYQAGMEQAMLLVSLERDKKPYTLNSAFNTELDGSRSQRVLNPLKRKASIFNNDVKYNAHEDIHDILQSYYKVARERFVDNVYRHAVDHCLLTGPMSPLLLFTEKWVLSLDEEKLNCIAGESRSVREKREQLRKKVQDLQSALKILR
ncbi:hypothetical protein J3459_013642 [Metarhizium acridum]|nr:hypothetical protein J3459_013642 [Metarhizium acridum]